MSSDVSGRSAPQRLPRNYWTILEAVRAVSAGTHLTAHDVFERARRAQPKLGFATVHRGLARLSELGFVVKVDVPGAASAVYEPASQAHSHFRCASCGGIRDVDFRVSQEVLARLSEQHGLEIAVESTTFVGRCANCIAI